MKRSATRMLARYALTATLAVALTALLAAVPAQAQQYSSTINVTTDQGAEITLTLGLDPDATAGIDEEFGEEELPPYPAGEFDIRFREGGNITNPQGDGDGPLGNGSRTSIMNGSLPMASEVTYSTVVQVAEEGNASNQYASVATLAFDFDPDNVSEIQLRDGFGGPALDETIQIEEGEQSFAIPLDDAADLGLSYVPVDVIFTQGILPVEFAGSPAARVDGRDVVLSWETLSETRNAGFYVERGHVQEGGAIEWRTANPGALVPTKAEGGTSAGGHAYDFQMTDLVPGRYVFRVQQVDLNGDGSYSPRSTEAQIGLEGFTLQAAYPNPLRAGDAAVLSFSADGSNEGVEAALYNSLGQRVRTLQAEGNRIRVPADGLASGLYFVRLTDGAGQTATQTITLVR